MAAIESDSQELLRERNDVLNVSLNLATGHDVKGLHVPDEVFGEIFIQCLPPSRFVVPSRSAAPLSVASVNSRWREAALATPQLWQSLAIDACTRALLRGLGYANFCSTWLSRAGGFPLSLSLRASGVPVEATNWLTDYIRGSSHLLREVDLQFGAVRQILSFPPAKYPLLETVSIDMPEDGILISFLDAPSLRQVSLSKYTAHVHLRRQQLTSFRCDSIDVLPMLGFFREAKELVHGRFTLGHRWGTESPQTIHSLPRLRSLMLEAKEVRDHWQVGVIPKMMKALANLRTPALEDLTLIYPLRNMRQPQDETVSRPFTTFVGQTPFQLHTLTLSFMPVSTSTLIICLRATPSVAHLKLLPTTDTDLRVFFNKLVDSPHLLPRLESFHLVNESGARNPTPEALIEVLSWRWGASIDVVQLRSFRMAVMNSIQNSRMIANIESQPRFEELKEEGMELYVETVDIL
ncbi:hypothetical protein R3P38DRAFT_2973449 [Favolaschia claudopus]|uniref:F-box domain-containing protein n=1 Tax=Favolaschia claudopus TaxID=2862362 RepID=A0AAW0B1N8_9AGAR